MTTQALNGLGDPSSTNQGAETTNTDTAGAGAGDGAAGAPAASWFEGFADDLKASPNVTRYKTPEEAARALDIATKRLGVPAEQLVKLPTKPDDAAGWGEVWDKLGRPKTAADYQLSLADGASDADKKFVEDFREVAHKAGMSQAQVAASVEYLNKVTTEAGAASEAASKAAAEATTASLKSEWGDKFPIYAREIPKLVEDLGGAEAIAALNADGMGNSATMLKILAKVADMRTEQGKLPGAGGGGGAGDGQMTPAQAQAARLALEADPVRSAALQDASSPMHAVVVAERNKLLQAERAKAA